MDPIEVTVRFTEQGLIIPLHFSWKGSVHRVESTGRCWTDKKGQHILVMVTTGKIYELTFKSGEGRWFIRHGEPGNTFI